MRGGDEGRRDQHLLFLSLGKFLQGLCELLPAHVQLAQHRQKQAFLKPPFATEIVDPAAQKGRILTDIGDDKPRRRLQAPGFQDSRKFRSL